MRNTAISRRLVNKIRELNVIQKKQLVKRACRRLVVESMEARQLLASDFLQDVGSTHFCQAEESVDVEQFSEIKIDADKSPVAIPSVVGDVQDVTLIQVESELTPSDVFGPKNLGRDESTIVGRSSQSSAIGVPASVVSASVFHDHSMFAIGGIDGAIDSGKQLALEGTEPTTLSFNNVLNNDMGITGLRFVMANLPTDQLTSTDFQIQLSPIGVFDQLQYPPSQWESGPDPESITIGELDVDQNRTVAIRWGRETIQNRWLRFTIAANENTGLSEPVVFYLGHLLGEVHQSPEGKSGELPSVLEVDWEDLKSIRFQVGTLALPSNIWDVNKDGVVSFQDIYESRSSLGNRLTLISVPGPVVAETSLAADGSTDLDEEKAATGDDRGGSEDSVVRMTSDPATVVGAFVYHRNSGLDGSGMEGALDSTTQLARETEQLTTLGVHNLINTSRGINGLVFDLMNMPAENLSLSDLEFQMSPGGAFNELTNPAINWELAPKPEQISVVKDQQTGISRVSIHWADNAIMNRWLRITILANSNTGLSAPVVYYLGHLQGKSTDWMINFGGLNPSGVYEVHTVDMLAIREQVGQNVGAGNLYDVNKDGVISYADISAMRDAVGTQLSNISIVSIVAAPPERMSGETAADDSSLTDLGDDVPKEEVIDEFVVDDDGKVGEDRPDSDAPVSLQTDSPATVVGAHVYYRNSSLAGSGMDGGIDTSKQLALETEIPMTLNYHNVINSDRGINGLVFDLSNLPGDSLSASDFVFQVSPMGAFNELSNPAGLWELADAPEQISVAKDQGTGLSRVSIGWQDNSIVNRWLRITILANPSTGLADPAVYYIGHLQGKSTPWLISIGSAAPSGVYEVDNVDMFAIREHVGVNVGASNLYDVNKDGVVSFADIAAMRNAVGMRLSNLTIVSLAATAAPMFSSVVDSGDSDRDRDLAEPTEFEVNGEVEVDSGLGLDSSAEELVDKGNSDQEQVVPESRELESPQIVDATLISLVEEMDVESVPI